MIPDLYDRELKFGEICKASWKVFCNSFKYLCVFYIAVSIGLRTIYRMLPLSQASEHRALSYFSGAMYTVLMSFAILGVVFVVVSFLENKTVSISGIFHDQRHKIFSGLVTSLLCQIPELLLWIPYFLVLPTGAFGQAWPVVVAVITVIRMLLIVYFIFSLQAVAVRGKSGIGALCYSCRTVWLNWGKVFGNLLLFELIVRTPIVVLETNFHIIWEIRIIVMAFIGTFSTVFSTILFLNIDRQQEALNPLDPVIPSKKS